jgi:endonuclease-3 related protein
LLNECKGNLSKLSKEDTGQLRKKLLKVKGVGPETADSILVYALEKPIFVVDAYTRRIFSRHKLLGEDVSYDEIQSLVHENLTGSHKAMNRFHAALVETGKRFCRKKKALCKECPLKKV